MGVKSLWTLLAPVGRPVMLETAEGKSMAIDSSIWIYQFQATMRDKEGHALVNAHVLGFLRRISKLLFYGIKPVFVFDGGAPALKRNTLSERKRKKAGAAASHHKLAEKLLAAQMRREALNYAKKSPKSKQPRPIELNDNTVYLEDIDGSAPRTPAKHKPSTPSASAKKNKHYDHDPYSLPEVNMGEAITKATRSAAPDPRLATEDELRAFIEDMRPEDFDINSPAFRELPTEVQYEIIGDLRLKSRQTSYARLHKMLKSARTPMDFSKQQIANLRQRNILTQQLLMTTDSIGSAHIAIPVRIASERNKEYILMKNEGEEGGWILGIKDIGTREKPIVLDHDDKKVETDDDSDADMEEVEVPAPAAPDPDLREYQREMALDGLSRRNTSKGLLPLKPINRKTKSNALFDATQTRSASTALPTSQSVESDDDDLMAYAIQASLDQRSSQDAGPSSKVTQQASSLAVKDASSEEDSDDDFYVDFLPPTRLQSALSMANARPSLARTPSTPSKAASLFGKPSLLSSLSERSSASRTAFSSTEDMESEVIHTLSPVQPVASRPEKSSSDVGQIPSAPSSNVMSLITPSGLLQQPVTPPKTKNSHEALSGSESDEDMQEVPVQTRSVTPLPTSISNMSEIPSPLTNNNQVQQDSESDGDMEEVSVPTPPHIETPQPITPLATSRILQIPQPPSSKVMPLFTPSDLLQEPVTRPKSTNSKQTIADPESDGEMEEVLVQMPLAQKYTEVPQTVTLRPTSSSSMELDHADTAISSLSHIPRAPSPFDHPITPPSNSLDDNSMESPFAWSRTPSPSGDVPTHPPVNSEDWDAAQEMDPQAEEGEFARFMSQVKGRDVEDVRKEIDEEIKSLNQQRKAAIRDSEDITQQMIAQIMTMLRLFGIPYITAPMEAEAQCAELVSLRLVDGVITDDSDVFLFGAERVYKNMFNQSKTVECFLSTDLHRELGLDRDTLIQLAYLLGSDYTEGLPGVGPVVAMELLKEFPGRNGLFRFKDWWLKVQSGKDREEDNKSKFRKQFKKKFKSLYLAEDWPNTVVRDAYYHPAVDSSEEPFKWGMPDLDGLREFFQAELGWRKPKVDELLLPIIQRMNKRNQVAALNKQGNLNNFLDISAGSGIYAPRQRQAYASKRLQQVISDFRNRQKSVSAAPQSRSASDNEAEHDNSGDEEVQPPKKRKRKLTLDAGSSKGKSKAKLATASSTRAKSIATRGTRDRGPGRGGKRQTGTKRAKSKESSASNEDEYFSGEGDFVPANAEDVERATELNLRPRPKPRPRYKGASKEPNEQGATESMEAGVNASTLPGPSSH